MNPDEIWSVWQTFGTPQQILSQTGLTRVAARYCTVILIFPEIISKASLAFNRTDVTRTLILPPLFEGLHNFYLTYAGYGYMFWVWIGVAILTAGLIVYRRIALESSARPARGRDDSLAFMVVGGSNA